MGDNETQTKDLDPATQTEVPDYAERRRRIEVLFMAHTRQPHPHGAKSWLARLLEVSDKTVRRWTRPGDRGEHGEGPARTPPPERWAEVEQLEAEVGSRRLAEAGRQLDAYYAKNPDQREG